MENEQKIIVIVGASRGIGRATALALAGPGTHLALAARDAAALETVAAAVRVAGGEATAIPGDITIEPSARHLMQIAAARTGRIDVLVNSAGGAVIAPFEQLSLADWEATLRTALTGTFLACKHAVAYMGAGALIVNVASVAARQAFPNWSAYVAAKHGVLGFSNAIREELRPRGIRVATLLPAATATALWDRIPGAWDRAAMLQPEDVARAIAQLVAQPPYVVTEELVIGHLAGRL
jgi:NAD(P)-dependent dehydrogenase (short-subunit alcohol dehydrogenase family)